MEMGDPTLFDLDWARVLHDLLRIGLAMALALPIGWERGHGSSSVGLRTLPVVAMSACGFALIAASMPDASAETQARVLQGIITGIGFIGGGAIVQRGPDVRGLVTAASVWNAGAIGVAIAYSRLEIAIVLSVVNVVILLALTPLVENGKKGDDAEE
ncbi:putative Mg2+ transporter-C (MgtC) family protein [Constrictibacter sp. MBR-5]|jgi:putative Mg2+ transporter-C (MgtC) family protein|uniref:MgtC/SapB family protein n=1 Tax=Constrictibacter sp. MBR-5 TaxID=3156467 RepID=UPI00339AA9A9